METYIELSVQARNQELFRAEEVSWKKGTSINVSCTTHEREAPQGRLTDYFTPRYS